MMASTATDLFLISSDVRDDSTGLHTPYGSCGLAYGGSVGFYGAGYPWIPRVGSTGAGECLTSDGYLFWVLSQLTDGVRTMSGHPDLYSGTYPACGAGDPDPTRWFPSPFDCFVDPDWTDCGGTTCSPGFSQHLITAHLPHDIHVITNHCRDGVQDYGETGVDTGGNCI
jgi:hypothetical protein